MNVRSLILRFKHRFKSSWNSGIVSTFCSTRRAFVPFLVTLCLYLTYNFQTAERILKISKNYLTTLSSSHSLTSTVSSGSQNGLAAPQRLLINTTSCKIPDFLPWSESAQFLQKKCTSYFKGPPNCHEKGGYDWTFVNGTYLYLNTTAIKESGYSWNTIRCCYRVISRVEQSLKNHDMNADRKIRYSKECYPITPPKQLVTDEFIRVFCMSTSIPLINDVVSREFHAIAQADNSTKQKIRRWAAIRRSNSKGDYFPPPNVIILGLDTMSRLNAHRTLNKTLTTLRSIGAIEIEGYTKVGETTFPSTIAFMSGYTIQELREHCYASLSSPHDYCPYVWKAYHKVGYLTATMEDVPLGTSFNFLKAGFVHKPTDFFPRPLMLAVMKHLPRENNWYVRCIGNRMTEEVILNYLNDILERVSSGAPVFIHSWLAVMAHECSLGAKYADQLLSNFLQRVDKENTIIMFMGDHGEVFGSFRETFQGWYEDKLPVLWVHLPKRLRDLFPGWVSSLHINSKRLTSHFDMYKTLVHILKTFDVDSKAGDTYTRLYKQKGYSLLEPVPEDRSCKDAGIPEGYCACGQPKSMNLSAPVVMKAANVALQYIIDMLPKECAVPSLKQVLDAKFFVTPKKYTVYIITFSTDPGEFMFEGTVKDEKNGGGGNEIKLVVANDVLRMNKIVRKADCIREPLLERYCYCK